MFCRQRGASVAMRAGAACSHLLTQTRSWNSEDVRRVFWDRCLQSASPSILRNAWDWNQKMSVQCECIQRSRTSLSSRKVARWSYDSPSRLVVFGLISHRGFYLSQVTWQVYKFLQPWGRNCQDMFNQSSTHKNFLTRMVLQVNFNMILQQVDRSVLQFLKQTDKVLFYQSCLSSL